MLRELVSAARSEGVATLRGTYLPTERNRIVADHYEKLGFRQLASDGAGSEWVLDLVAYEPPELPFSVVGADDSG